MTFTKEVVLPQSDRRLPFFVNLPPHDSRPIDNLVEYFKYWKYFIKALIFYFKEILLVKEYEANLNMQLLNTIQFPGFKDLPSKVKHEINAQITKLPHGLGALTPTKEMDEPPRPLLTRERSNNLVLARPEKEFQMLTHTIKKGAGLATGHKKTRSMGHNPMGLASSVSLSAPVSQSNDLNIPKLYFPGDSLFCNLSPMLLQHHGSQCTTNAKLARDLRGRLIPRAEALQKNLSGKIKEIKQTLRNDSFANTEILEEISNTGKVVAEFMLLVERYSAPKPVVKKTKYMLGYDPLSDQTEYNAEEDAALDDPFLVKMRLDYQIKKQLTMENYKFASYVNLQQISHDLYTYVIKDLVLLMEKFGKLEFSHEIYEFFNNKLRQQSVYDWRFFISHNKAFLNIYEDNEVNPKRETRLFKQIVVPYGDSIHSKCLRTGPMYKKSKMLKNYTKFYYVLSANYLHEYREEDWKLPQKNGTPKKKKVNEFGINHKDIPVKSYNLNEYQITLKDEGEFKFVLSKRGKSMHGKVTFRCMASNDFSGWYSELRELLSFEGDHLARFEFIRQIMNRREADKQTRLNLKKQLALKEHLAMPKELLHPQVFEDMFEPHVATPRIQLPEDEMINPFEFTTDSNKESPDTQTPDSTLQPTPSATTHDQFMKLQQAAIQQQLGSQLSERLASAQLTSSNQLVTPRGSNDLLKLMMLIQAPDVGKILAQHDTKNHATFSLDDDLEDLPSATKITLPPEHLPTTSLGNPILRQSPVPTLSVSHHD